ncbi:MAG TPA: monofunctional biosynthetic peptidoglycan transglycosylase [Anaeromyxobacteraceae bacterium]|nr:monofunctional biosynthetic peptidoglycan transglycosylase [Anaeromyxobacteraceae bacterium]
MAEERTPRTARRRQVRRALTALAALVAGAVALLAILWVALPDPGPLAARNPPTTALIEQRKAEAARARQRYRPQQAWVPLERMSRRLVEAVVAAEDAKFFGHGGFDWDALEDAARHDLARGRFARGASTITQQLAKNLYLGTEKSLLRKAKEAVLAAKLERALPKRRILALYLNVVEWGNGVFGAEAGARHHLGASAGSLTTAQAVLMASMLPAPRKVDLAHPSAWLRRRAVGLLDRLHAERRITDDEHRSASAELERLLAGPAPAVDEPEVPADDEEVVAAPATAPSPAPTPAAAAEEPPNPNPNPTQPVPPSPTEPVPVTPSPGEPAAPAAPPASSP